MEGTEEIIQHPEISFLKQSIRTGSKGGFMKDILREKGQEYFVWALIEWICWIVGSVLLIMFEMMAKKGIF
ncbi:MAG: hypothetical protein GY749_12315 [Desulfobacteraceae bacterium]|nr:hypothetical protein [Desulfobacteraceae bacterium]